MLLLLGVVVGVALIGGAVAAGVMLSMRGAAAGSREAPVPLATAAASTPTAVPPTWGWAHLNERGKKYVGYYYRDRMAGLSFHVLYEATTPSTADALRASGYRGSLTIRLPAHESMRIPEGAVDLAGMLRESFEAGGVNGCAVLMLTASERAALGLPEAPAWIEHYLR